MMLLSRCQRLYPNSKILDTLSLRDLLFREIQVLVTLLWRDRFGPGIEENRRHHFTENDALCIVQKIRMFAGDCPRHGSYLTARQ